MRKWETMRESENDGWKGRGRGMKGRRASLSEAAGEEKRGEMSNLLEHLSAFFVQVGERMTRELEVRSRKARRLLDVCKLFF